MEYFCVELAVDQLDCYFSSQSGATSCMMSQITTAPDGPTGARGIKLRNKSNAEVESCKFVLLEIVSW
jgi:hypothetical protein